MISNNSTYPFSINIINTLSYNINIFITIHISKYTPNPNISPINKPTLIKISKLNSNFHNILKSLNTYLN